MMLLPFSIVVCHENAVRRHCNVTFWPNVDFSLISLGPTSKFKLLMNFKTTSSRSIFEKFSLLESIRSLLNGYTASDT